MKLEIMFMLISVTVRRILPVTSFLSRATGTLMTTTATTRPKKNTIHLPASSFLLPSVRNVDTTLTSIPHEKRRPSSSASVSKSGISGSGSSSSRSTRDLSSFSNSGRDAFKEGLYRLARSERDNNNRDLDKEFNLFDDIPEEHIEFRTGLPILVEVISFGPLGASVAVIGKGGHNPNKMELAHRSNPLAMGLIYQSEIHYYRESRGNVDVVLGEVLPCYVEKVRDDKKIDVALRPIGGQARVDRWSSDVLNRIEEVGVILLGNKSTAMDVAREFPGMSKRDFKRCVGALFERHLVYPLANSVVSYDEGLAIVAAEQEAERTESDASKNNSNSNSSYNASSDNNNNTAGDYNQRNDDGDWYNSGRRK